MMGQDAIDHAKRLRRKEDGSYIVARSLITLRTHSKVFAKNPRPHPRTAGRALGSRRRRAHRHHLGESAAKVGHDEPHVLAWAWLAGGLKFLTARGGLVHLTPAALAYLSGEAGREP